MIAALGSRDRRALIVGVMTIGGLALSLRAVPAWLRWRNEIRAAAAEAIVQQRRVEGLVAGFSHSLDSLEARTTRLKSLGPAFLTGATPTEAASMLAGLVGEIARSALVRIDGIEMRVDTARGTDMRRVRIEAQATGDIAGLAALLHGLEKGPTLLAVRRLAVRAQTVDGPSDHVESLAIRFTIEGLALLR